MFYKEDGFFLYEQIINIMLIIFILPILVILLSSIHSSEIQEEYIIEQFFIFLKDELNNGEDVTFGRNTLYIVNSELEEVTIKKINNRIKRIFKGGNEDLLFKVDYFELEKIDDRMVKVKIKREKEYEKILFYK